MQILTGMEYRQSVSVGGGCLFLTFYHNREYRNNPVLIITIE